MTRLSNWEARLSTFLKENSKREFSYGEFDCALFAASAAEAVTGEDRAADFRERYDDREGAARALREIGEGTLLATYQARFDEKPVAFAKRGDLVWDGERIGVCNGNHALFVGQEGEREGLIRFDMSVAVKAFEVG